MKTHASRQRTAPTVTFAHVTYDYAKNNAVRIGPLRRRAEPNDIPIPHDDADHDESDRPGLPISASTAGHTGIVVPDKTDDGITRSRLCRLIGCDHSKFAVRINDEQRDLRSTVSVAKRAVVKRVG